MLDRSYTLRQVSLIDNTADIPALTILAHAAYQ